MYRAQGPRFNPSTIKKIKEIPFIVKRRGNIELEDGNGSYICECGHVHNYSKIDLHEIEKEAKENKTYTSAKEMIEDILKEE